MENAAAGQVVDLAVVHAEQFAADLAGARSPRVPGAAFPAGSQEYGAATDSAGSSPSIEIADALLGLAVLRLRLPRSRGIAVRGFT